MSGAELAAVRVVVRRELRRRPVADARPSTRNLRSALAELDALGDGPAWTAPVRRGEPLPDVVALDAVARVLSGTEWSADTAPEVAEVVRLTGREVADFDGYESCACGAGCTDGSCTEQELGESAD